jgi:hypothetical protein
VKQESWRRFEVILTGAFLTGTPLQVPIGDASRIQATLGNALMQDPNDGWSFEPLAAQDPGGSYDGAGGYPSLVPLVLVKRQGPMLLAALKRAIGDLSSEPRRWLKDEMRGWQWNIDDVSIDLYDFGTGVFRCAVKVQPPTGMPVTQIRDHIVRLSRTKADPDADVEVPLATALQVLTQETAKQFSSIANTLVAHAVETPWAQPMIDAIGTDETEQPGLAGGRGYRWGKLLCYIPYSCSSRQPDRDAKTHPPSQNHSGQTSTAASTPTPASSCPASRSA